MGNPARDKCRCTQGISRDDVTARTRDETGSWPLMREITAEQAFEHAACGDAVILDVRPQVITAPGECARRLWSSPAS